MTPVQTEKAVTRLGLIGLGTVGGGVAEILAHHQDLIQARLGASMQIIRAMVRDTSRQRGGAAAAVELTTEPAKIVQADDVDIVVELMGGVEGAYTLVRTALEHGKPVVTANKALLAQKGPELYAIAQAHGVDVYFEAAVAGGIPIIRTMREGWLQTVSIRCVAFLTAPQISFLDSWKRDNPMMLLWQKHNVLVLPRQIPPLDVNGGDAADKLAILAQLAFGVEVKPQAFYVRGVESMTADILRDADELGYVVKLLGVARRVITEGTASLDISVQPMFVPKQHSLASVRGSQNAIAVVSEALGQTLYQGPGAGALPTGSAVVSDLIESARSLRLGVSGRVRSTDKTKLPLTDAAHNEASYYLRFNVKDIHGVLATVTRILAEHRVGIDSVRQRSRHEGGGLVPLLLVTHPAAAGSVEAAMKDLAAQDCVGNEVQMIPIVAS